MKKLKRNSGITLIALIITIIVMLLLVGVTISVVLNGGLFTTAKSAATNTIIEAEKEHLLSAVVASMGDDAKVNFAKLDSNLPTSEWTGKNGTYTSPKENKYTVNEKGEITQKGDYEVKTNYYKADLNGNIMVFAVSKTSETEVKITYYAKLLGNTTFSETSSMEFLYQNINFPTTIINLGNDTKNIGGEIVEGIYEDETKVETTSVWGIIQGEYLYFDIGTEKDMTNYTLALDPNFDDSQLKQ